MKKTCGQEFRLREEKAKRTRKAWLPYYTVNPDKLGSNHYEQLGRVQEYTTKPTQKIMVGKISKIMLEAKFKQNHETKSKTHCQWKTASV